MDPPNPVNASSSVAARGVFAVVDIFRTVGSRPSVDTDAVVASQNITAGTSVLTDSWQGRTLVYVLGAVFSGPSRWTLTGVPVDPVNAS